MRTRIESRQEFEFRMGYLEFRLSYEVFEIMHNALVLLAKDNPSLLPSRVTPLLTETQIERQPLFALAPRIPKPKTPCMMTPILKHDTVNLDTHGEIVLDARSNASHELEEDNQVLVNADGYLVLLVVTLGQNLPFITTVFCGFGVLVASKLQALGLINKTFHTLVSDFDATLQFGRPQLQGSVGAVKEDLHDAGVAAGVDRGGFDGW